MRTPHGCKGFRRDRYRHWHPRQGGQKHAGSRCRVPASLITSSSRNQVASPSNPPMLIPNQVRASQEVRSFIGRVGRRAHLSSISSLGKKKKSAKGKRWTACLPFCSTLRARSHVVPGPAMTCRQAFSSHHSLAPLHALQLLRFPALLRHLAPARKASPDFFHL